MLERDAGFRVPDKHLLVEPPDALKLPLVIHQLAGDLIINCLHCVLLPGDHLKVLIVVRHYGEALTEIVELLLQVFEFSLLFRRLF